MKNYEPLHVYIRYRDGKVVCLCLRRNRRCPRDCEPEIVLRDKFYDWISTFRQDKFGRSKL